MKFSEIRLAQPEDLQEIKFLTEACAQAMIEKGIFQWNEHYPSLEKLSADIQQKQLYKYAEKGQIRGIIVLTEIVDEKYLPVKWLTENGINLYIHRLATHPGVWGKGYGQKMMDFAEDFARKNKFTSVRLDTFSKNQRNQRFYEARGYKKLDDIYFPKQSEFPFHCYELVL